MARRLMHALVYGGFVDGAVGLKHEKGEIVIKVEAASINPLDWKIYNLRLLVRPLLSTVSHPPIPGNDVAGEVVEVGSGVQKFKPGDKVITVLSVYTAGGLSEYCVAKEKVTVLRPAEVSAAEGAGLPIAGLTALISLTQYADLKLDQPGSGPQKNILVTADSGGVGQYAVQLAKLGNAHVLIHYKAVGEGAASLRSPSGRKYDAVVHCAPTVAWSKLTFSKKKLFTFMLTPNDDEGLKFLVGLMKEGKLKTVIDSKHAWS
ncbi:hypothetical protein SASPL_104758 [Salvia splendens]|uniref:Enoyl reductase (ER) domain-containing protein n=1 Tax=Salvia splendens TaxID=180675 RepID=A0A8X8YK10_SALSN|nr:hypothetical protein SASPL_104758 [Salvia splendens]